MKTQRASYCSRNIRHKEESRCCKRCRNAKLIIENPVSQYSPTQYREWLPGFRCGTKLAHFVRSCSLSDKRDSFKHLAKTFFFSSFSVSPLRDKGSFFSSSNGDTQAATESAARGRSMIRLLSFFRAIQTLDSPTKRLL